MEGLVKYPKTMHLPWSPGLMNDDRVISDEDLKSLLNSELCMTEKMDGENTTMYRNAIHARSLDSKHHESRDYVKAVWGRIAHLIPEDYRIVGENVYAVHSIEYENLDDYFLVHSIWKGNVCFSYDDTMELCQLFGLKHVPLIAISSNFNRASLSCTEYYYSTSKSDSKLYKRTIEGQVEGYVLRVKDEFLLEDFNRSIAKYVRKGHVQTDEHWMNKPVVANKLAGAKNNE